MKFFFALLVFNYLFMNKSYSENLKECKTLRQSGLDFIGKDHQEIIEYLGLKSFKIKISRTRKKIFIEQLNEKNKKTNLKNLKNVHFLELILLKSTGYPIVFQCSWRFNINLDQIEDNNFDCIEIINKKDLFSLDYDGNFDFSSNFQFFNSKQTIEKGIKKTLHSLFGRCKNIQK